MKRKKIKMIAIVLLYAVSVIMSWGGMIYATYNPDFFRPIGVVIALIGYGLLFGTTCLYENADTE